MSRLWPLGRSSDSELQRTRLWFADKLKRREPPLRKRFCTAFRCIALSSLHLQFSLLWGTHPHAAARIAPACLLAVTAIALTSLACTQRMQLFFLLHARTQPIAPCDLQSLFQNFGSLTLPRTRRIAPPPVCHACRY